ncbi:hypothetical protein ACFXGT_13935 [Streptomyces sp. NPDC059352]|uniref:hypothetical protein n=1 Tax=Streptomyces sp. NPDC059352 TaxID=3346810 RepID=UPI003680C43B
MRVVITLLAPTPLAGFVVAEIAGPEGEAVDTTVLAGPATALALRLLRAPLPVALVGAAATAALRLVSG